MKKYLIILLFMFFGLNNLLIAQSGSIDLSFNSSDVGFSIGDGPNYRVYTTSVQSDGKIIIGGCFRTYNGISRSGIARLNSDGSIDTSFNPGNGILGINGLPAELNTYVNSIAIQSDGKIIIGGKFSSYNGVARNNIARLNPDGNIDQTFNPMSGANNGISAIIIQNDGKIIITGSFTTYNGINQNRIARLNPDGSLDNTFNSGSGANASINSLAKQSDGKIVIVGFFTVFNGVTKNRIARLNSDGSLDETFNIGTGFATETYSLAIQNDGKILVGGGSLFYNGINVSSDVIRLNSDGTRDFSFSPLNYSFGTIIRSIVVQDNGKIIMGGAFGNTNNWIIRMNPNGSVDPTFSVDNYVATDHVHSISILTDGKIIIGGEFDDKKNYICRLTSEGALDMSFNISSGLNGLVNTTAVQSDGKIIVGGNFSNYNNSLTSNLTRLNSDGSKDNSFYSSNGIIDGFVNSSAIQSDGKILVVGHFGSYYGFNASHILRLNIDGSIDPTFNSGLGTDQSINSIAIQSDGKIIIAGGFDTYNGVSRIDLARLNSDGTLDPTFLSGSGADGIILTTATQPDGNILIGGFFSEYWNQPISNLLRINTFGGPNSSLDARIRDNGILSIAIQNDGNIIIGGDFYIPATDTIRNIARVLPNGNIDTTFKIGTGANKPIYSVVLQEDGKIIIGGDFTSLNGLGVNRFARLNKNGSLDTTFDVGAGVNGLVRTISMQSDKKIIIGGDFTSIDGVGRNRIARIMNDYLSFHVNPIDVSICEGDSTSFNTISNGIGLNYQWQVSTNGGITFTNISSAGSNPTYIGFMSDTLKIINTNLSINGNIYRCVLSNNSLPSHISNPAKLFISSAVPSQPSVITGNINQCVGTYGTVYSVVNVPGFTYNWTVPDNWNINGGQGTNSISVTVGTTSGNISVVPFNGCGSGPIQTLAITTKPAPAQPDSIIGSSALCAGVHNLLYRVDSVANADLYYWVVPAGWTITSGQWTDSLYVTSTNASSGVGNISVSARNSCGISTVKKMLITRSAYRPSTPIIYGDTYVCPDMDTLTFHVYNRVGESYNWSVPNGWTIISGQGTSQIIVLPGLNSGNIEVIASNGCGNSDLATKYIQITSLPTTPNAINGLESVCQGQNSVTYNVPTIDNATSYIWTFSSEVTGSSTTNSITVNFGASAVSGNITVRGHNDCGDGAVSILPITVNPRVVNAGTISGATTACQGQNSVTYNVPTIANATSYIWTLPNGATGTSTTNSITVNFGASAVSGNIIVSGHNDCGDGGVSHLPITVNPMVASADIISGATTICLPENAVTYTVPVITNATSYIWTLPNGATGTSTTNSISVTYGTATTGNITVKGHNDCGDGAISSLPITITQTPATPTISNIGNNVLSSSSTSGNQWYNQNGIINGAVSQNYTTTANGSYFVIVNYGNCYSNTSNHIQITNTGIENINSNGSFSVYPNPTKSSLNILVNQKLIGSEFSITDQLGRKVITGKLTTENTVVEVGNLSNGIYLLRIGENAQQTFKVVKE